MKKPGLTYKDCGVDIDRGADLVNYIKKHNPASPFLMQSRSDFAAGFQLEAITDKPVLVTSTDGVGTKLKVAFEYNKHDTVGIDLVAMVVNDIICQGARPLFFLDYFATGKLEPTVAQQVLNGIIEGCKIAQCSLVGGETAELPGLYNEGEYDLAGFGVGIIEKKHFINAENVNEGDVIIGIHSSGLHSNGYSLARRVFFSEMGLNINDKFVFSEINKTVGDVLLTPTKIYVNSVLSAYDLYDIHGIANITGGGIIENLARIIPDNCSAIIQSESWNVPDIFTLIQTHGNISIDEMRKTFNMGIGMILIVPEMNVRSILRHLRKEDEVCSVIGDIVPRRGDNKVVFI